MKAMKFQKGTIFTLFLLVLFAFVIQQAIGFPLGSGLYPLVIASMSLILVVIQLSLELRGRGEAGEAVDIAVDESIKGRAAMRRAVRFLAWFAGLYLGIWLIGFRISTILFFVLFMRLEGRIRWPLVIVLTAAASALVVVYFPVALGMLYPTGLLGKYIPIPWPE